MRSASGATAENREGDDARGGGEAEHDSARATARWPSRERSIDL